MAREYYVSSIPQTGVNMERLQAELSALGDVGITHHDSYGWRVDVLDDGIANAQVQAVIDAHDASVQTSGQVEREELRTFLSRSAIATLLQSSIALRDGIVAEAGTLNGEITALNGEISTVAGTAIDLVFTAEIKAQTLAELRFKRDTKVSIRTSKQAIRDLINNQLYTLRALRELWVS